MGQQVTALTAEKTLELADENITGAVRSGGHLILRRRKWILLTRRLLGPSLMWGQ